MSDNQKPSGNHDAFEGVEKRPSMQGAPIYHRPPQEIERAMQARHITKMQQQEFMYWRVQRKRRQSGNAKVKAAVATPANNEIHSPKESAKGNLTISLENPVTDDNNAYLNMEQETKTESKKSLILRSLIISFIGLIVSLLFNLLIFHLPYTPAIVTIDFSSFPELWIGLSIHPLAGIAIVIIKNALYYLIRPGGLASILGKIILDSLFIVLSWVFTRMILNSNWLKRDLEKREMMALPVPDRSGLFLTIGGIASGVVTAFVSVLTFKCITLPILYKKYAEQGYTPEMILQKYQDALFALQAKFPFVKTFVADFATITQGALFYNVPLMLIKYSVSAIFVAVLYNVTFQMLHRK